MINFPLLRRVRSEQYLLYPGPGKDHIMDLEFGDGSWLILGVNGLGKSTLLHLARNLLAGAVRTRQAGFAGDRNDIQPIGDRFFAVRVGDDAREATGLLEVSFGASVLTVSRRLSNLTLISASLSKSDGTKEEIEDEAQYRAVIATLMGLEGFEDCLRVIDNVMFFLEARRSLIWDDAAQFEIFRALLTPADSAALRALEGRIVSADSSARNLSSVIYKITKDQQKEAKRHQTAGEVRAKLASLRAALNEQAVREENLQGALDSLEEERDDARLQLKRAENEAAEATREYEAIKFSTLKSAFENISPTQQYLFLKLATERVCFACGQEAAQAAETIQHRIAEGLCPVCGSTHPSRGISNEAENFPERAELAYGRIEQTRFKLQENIRTYDDRVKRAAAVDAELIEVRREIEHIRLEMRKLNKLLPQADVEKLEQEQSRINAFMEQMKEFQKQRTAAEDDIQYLLDRLKKKTEEVTGVLQAAFDKMAKPFFAEQVRLVYAPRLLRIGQAGKQFPFPAFEIEMTSGATQGDYVRRKVDQVSLSQREYLDIIFRMVLIEVLGQSGGSLIVDGPEGSVDAVFAAKAGDLFSAFSERAGQNTILACNIVEGDFIPRVLKRYDANEKKTRVINLLDQAVPTAALRVLEPLYLEKIDKILGDTP